ncbi:amidohydrolase [Vineibacter terrae]|uniref:Amidohydrolase n=1 Tax=Vineibacter terrae TaxID=2586908 RepID=A0A5C8PCM6_9HYPH|nr:amidohydrolase [Vineibacter terrae]TXL71053.1 amidohydrolase [Vineibacter terrae]
MVKATTHTVIRGGRMIDPGKRQAVAADILIKGDTIAAIGRPKMAAPQDASTIDAQGRLLHAGLVNAHMHSHGGLARGLGDRWTLELLLTAGPWLGGGRTVRDKYLSALLVACEMLLKGCTATYDLMAEFPTPSVDGIDAVARAYSDAGLRAVLAPMTADISFFDAIPGLMDRLPPALRREAEAFRLAPYRASIRQMKKILHGWSYDRALVRPALAPTIPHHCSDPFLAACRDLARDYGVGMHTHVSESKVQVIAGYQRYGTSLTWHLDALGIVGPDFTVAHGVWLDHDDMQLLGDKGASVAHNPGSNMRLGSGLADMRGMLERKVNVGIGTDGASCADNQNMYEAMRLASFASKVQGPDIERWITTDEALHAATLGSARALGFGDDIGRLAPGCKADIVFLELAHPNWMPCNDPVNALVHAEDGTAVHSVMVGGRMVVENRKLLTVDLATLAREVDEVRERLQRATRPAKAVCDRLEKVVGAFCPGLARQPLHIHRYGASHAH